MKTIILLLLGSIFIWMNLSALKVPTNAMINASKELLMVIEVCRHGARTPRFTDKRGLNLTWDRAPGQLTELGESQHYEIGQRIRQRYINESNFLPDKFDPAKILAISTEVNRTILSACHQLSGMYPSESISNQNATSSQFDLNFPYKTFLSPLCKSFPINVIPRSSDVFMHGHDISLCPAASPYIAESVKNVNESTVEKFQPLYRELIEKFEAEPGTTMKEARKFLDSWEMATIHGKIIENDLSEEAQALVKPFFGTYFYQGKFGDDRVIRLATTEFLEYLINAFKNKVLAIEGEKDVPDVYKQVKFILFSGHDTTVAPYLQAIEQPQDHMPPVGSTIFIELFKMNSDYCTSWKYNDKILNVGPSCDEHGNCELFTTLEYLKSRTDQSLRQQCYSYDNSIEM